MAPGGVVKEMLRVLCYGGEIGGQLGAGSASSHLSFSSPPSQRRTITLSDPSASRGEPGKGERRLYDDVLSAV